jgi:hypothetical protein
VQAHARPDPELGEHLLQVPFDGARAQEQLAADLRVRESLACEARDLLLLWRQLIASLGPADPEEESIIRAVASVDYHLGSSGRP